MTAPTAAADAGRRGIHLGRFFNNIMSAHLGSWRLHLKAVAIYRDGSQRVQAVSTAEKQQQSSFPAESTPRPSRRKLPDERQSITHKFSIGGHEGYITVGLYEDGTPGEIFITMAKEGSTISGLMDSMAVVTSLSLQIRRTPAVPGGQVLPRSV
jgi:ribonucleoside-diphosphate reductase alpha chain